MKIAIFVLLGLVAASSAASISLIPAGASLIRAAAPAYYLQSPSLSYALAPSSSLVLSRSAALPSLQIAAPQYASIRTLLPSISGAYYI